MSDEKLRELERRFRETGSAEDEVAWLRERARSGERLDWESYARLQDLDLQAAANYLRSQLEAGDLSGWQLNLAAKCGSRAAARVALRERTSLAPPKLAVLIAESAYGLWWPFEARDDQELGLRCLEAAKKVLAGVPAELELLVEDFCDFALFGLGGAPGERTRAAVGEAMLHAFQSVLGEDSELASEAIVEFARLAASQNAPDLRTPAEIILTWEAD